MRFLDLLSKPIKMINPREANVVMRPPVVPTNAIIAPIPELISDPPRISAPIRNIKPVIPSGFRQKDFCFLLSM